jgi:hypothetical protein
MAIYNEKICPLYGLNQHSTECWHDSLTTTCFFTDGIGDIIQNIFNNNTLDTIIRKIRNNFKNNIIPKYYLPFNVENRNEDLKLYHANCIEYIKNLHSIYTNIKLHDESLTKPTGFVRQNSETDSFKCIKNIFNMYNINTNRKYVYTQYEHSGYLPHYIIQLNTINYLFMNYFRKSKNDKSKIQYIYPEIIDFKYYINVLTTNFENNYIYITNLVLHLGRILELLPKSLGVIISSYKKDKEIGQYIYHDQSFITCNNKYYFYDNEGIDDKSINLTTVEFEWKKYLEKKIKFIINELNTKYIDKTDYSMEKFLALIEIIESISDLYNGHHVDSDFAQVGKMYLKNYNIFSLFFIFKTNETSYNDYYKNYNRILYYSDISYYYNNQKILNYISDHQTGIFGYDIYNFPSYIISDLEKGIINNNSNLLNLFLQKDTIATPDYIPLEFYKRISQKFQLMQQLYKTSDIYKEKTDDEIKLEIQQKFKKKYLKYKNKYLNLL